MLVVVELVVLAVEVVEGVALDALVLEVVEEVELDALLAGSAEEVELEVAVTALLGRSEEPPLAVPVISVDVRVVAPVKQLYVEIEVVVVVEVDVGANVTVFVTETRVEAPVVTVTVCKGAVTVDVLVVVKLEGVMVCVVEMVEVPMDKKELQKGVAEEAFRTDTTSETSRHALMLTVKGDAAARPKPARR